jgi:hypothetical protein
LKKGTTRSLAHPKLRREPWFIGKKSPAALFSDIGCVVGGKKRGLIYLRKGRLH